MGVIYILGGLFIALIVIVPLIEKHGRRFSSEEMSKMSRWIWPLVAIMLILQLVRMAFLDG